MMCSVKGIESLELVTLPVTSTQIIITQAHTPLLVYGIGSLHACHKGRYTLRILVLSGLVIESSLHGQPVSRFRLISHVSTKRLQIAGTGGLGLRITGFQPQIHEQ